ncbi:MAG: LemA family protein [Planctomycetota bacterium]|nr:LemA family protein [Planctomycetota bacterium]
MWWIIGGVVCVVGVIALFLLLYLWSIYNGLVVQRNRYKNAFSQIDVQLKRRYDLIPNLVEVAKGYMKHESETLEAVIAARNTAISAQKAASANPGEPGAMQNLAQSESALGGTLSRLLMVSEAYPDLKANENMLSLQEELTTTENKVTFARQGYNDSVTAYNTSREVFPAVLVANSLGFQQAELWELDEQEAEAARARPKVEF